MNINLAPWLTMGCEMRSLERKVVKSIEEEDFKTYSSLSKELEKTKEEYNRLTSILKVAARKQMLKLEDTRALEMLLFLYEDLEEYELCEKIKDRIKEIS